MDKINKRDKSHETFQLEQKKQEITKPGNLHFRFVSNLNPDFECREDQAKRAETRLNQVTCNCFSESTRRTDGAEGALNSKNGRRPSARRTKDKSSRLCRVPKNMMWRGLHDNAEKTIQYVQINHVIEKPKINNAVEERNLKKAKANLMVNFRTLIHENLVDPKLNYYS